MDEESRLNLEQDVPAVEAFLAENGGTLACDASVYWLTLRPRSATTERYFARVVWTRYPHQAPSVAFATAVRGDLRVTRAWPNIPGYRVGSFDICRPFTAEGYALHSEWNSGSSAWPTVGNPFLWVAQELQFDLDNSYSGRAA